MQTIGIESISASVKPVRVLVAAGPGSNQDYTGLAARSCIAFRRLLVPDEHMCDPVLLDERIV